MPIRVMIVEPHVLARDEMVGRLRRHSDIEVVAAVAGDLPVEELDELARMRQPDVVVLDFSTQGWGTDSLAMIEVFTNAELGIRLLTLVSRLDGIVIRRLKASNVTGCLFSDDRRCQPLENLVREVNDGRIIYSKEIDEPGFRDPGEHLTLRELDVLLLVEHGLSNRGIAQRLSISPLTVQNHISNIYWKLAIPADTSLNRRVTAVRLTRRWERAQKSANEPGTGAL